MNKSPKLSVLDFDPLKLFFAYSSLIWINFFEGQYHNIWFQWSYIQLAHFCSWRVLVFMFAADEFFLNVPSSEQLYLPSYLRDCHFPNLNWSLGKITLLTASESVFTSQRLFSSHLAFFQCEKPILFTQHFNYLLFLITDNGFHYTFS